MLHVADIHLGYRQYGLAEREEDIYRDAWKVAEIALREHVDAVLISGDLFDQAKPPIRALREARLIEQKLAEQGIKIYAVLGDHDTPKYRDYPPHVLLDHVRVLGTSSTSLVKELGSEPGGRRYVLVGISYRGRGNRARRMLRELLGKAGSAMAGGVGILMMHQGIKEFFPLDAQLSVADIPGTARYVAMGHIHKRIKQDMGGRLLVYPGSIDIIRRDEIRDWEKNGKGPVLVDLSGDEPEAEMLKLDIRPQLVVEADYRNAAWMVREALRKTLGLGSPDRKPIIHLTLIVPQVIDRDVVDDVSRLIGDKALLRIRVKRRGGEEDRRTPAAVDDIAVIAELLQGNRGLARMIYEFKEALASRNHALASQLAEEIVRDYEHQWRLILEGKKTGKPRTLADYVGGHP